MGGVGADGVGEGIDGTRRIRSVSEGVVEGNVVEADVVRRSRGGRRVEKWR